jgi:hypothetical protein
MQKRSRQVHRTKSGAGMPASGPSAVKRKYKPGTVWLRKCDGKEFTLKEKDEKGLVFRGFTGHFLESMFRPR